MCFWSPAALYWVVHLSVDRGLRIQPYSMVRVTVARLWASPGIILLCCFASQPARAFNLGLAARQRLHVCNGRAGGGTNGGSIRTRVGESGLAMSAEREGDVPAAWREVTASALAALQARKPSNRCYSYAVCENMSCYFDTFWLYCQYRSVHMIGMIDRRRMLQRACRWLPCSSALLRCLCCTGSSHTAQPVVVAARACKNHPLLLMFNRLCLVG